MGEGAQFFGFRVSWSGLLSAAAVVVGVLPTGLANASNGNPRQANFTTASLARAGSATVANLTATNLTATNLTAASGAGASQTLAAPLKVTVRPILGEYSTSSNGWSAYVVDLFNPTASSLGGSVHLLRTSGTFRSSSDRLIEAEFWVEPGQTVRLKLPAHGYQSRYVEAVAFDESRRELGRGQSESAASFESPFLFALDSPSRVVPLVRGQTHPSLPTPPGGAPVVAFADSAYVDAKSGEPILPEHSASYGPTTAVITNSSTLISLRGQSLSALVGWIVAGGSLAVAIDREQDLEHQTVRKLIGVPIESLEAGSNEVQSNEVKPLQIKSLQVTPPTQGEESAEEPRANGSSALSTALSTASSKTTPPPASFNTRTFSGGNLREVPWGAVASYGLGEVHLLGFDVSQPLSPAEEDWTRMQLLSLLGNAWQRQDVAILPQGRVPFSGGNARLREVLVSQASNPWTLAGAALLLLVYALLAGPVNFRVQANAGRPLRALYRLPLWSAAALTAVLVIGAASRGDSARAQHLTLVEAGAGMPRSAAIRFRAFFDSTLDDLRVQASERGAVLALAETTTGASAQLVSQPTGLAVTDIHTKPWKTAIIREEGFASLGQGVAMVQRDGELWLKNRLGRPLIGVIVSDAQGRMFFFDRIEDGQGVEVTTGEAVLAPATGSHAAPVDRYVRRLNVSSDGLGDAWQAIGSMSSGTRRWWPSDVPVLIGQVVGGEGKLTDSGVELSEDRTLLRVVGYGGPW